MNSFEEIDLHSELLRAVKEIGFEKATLLTRTDNKSMKILATKVGFIPGKKRRRNGHSWQKYVYNLEKRKK